MEKISNFSFCRDDFSFKRDEIVHPSVGLVLVDGPSGAGKTSFMRALAGLESEYASFDWTLKTDQFGFHFQDMKLFSGLSVEENLELIGAKKEDRDLLLNKLHLSKKASLKVSSLSGGEVQRLGFIRAIVNQPRVIFLDEPFGQVHHDLRKTMYLLLTDYVSQESLVFISTHIKDEINCSSVIKIS